MTVGRPKHTNGGADWGVQSLDPVPPKFLCLRCRGRWEWGGEPRMWWGALYMAAVDQSLRSQTFSYRGDLLHERMFLLRGGSRKHSLVGGPLGRGRSGSLEGTPFTIYT